MFNKLYEVNSCEICVLMFGYDAFGNVRSSQGIASDSTGGDFRFQGQWLESATKIYHFRARDYDSRTGTFFSRDPVDPTSQAPEAFNPYQFAYNNPQIYSDPSGMITISELTSVRQIENVLQSIRADISNRAKQYLIDKAKGVAGEVVKDLVSKLLPSNTFGAVTALENADFATRYLRAGEKFEDILVDKTCDVIKGGYPQFAQHLWLQSRVRSNGNPIDDGFPCGSTIPDSEWFFEQKLFGARPDFIIKDGGPKTTDKRPKAFLIGDVKLSGNAIVDKIGSSQWDAIMNYAKYGNGHQYTPISLFVTFWNPTEAERKKVEKEAWSKGVSAAIVPILPTSRR